MRDKLIISASGPDRKGIVSEISSIINQYNGNIETSRMIRLEEQFSILILIEIENKNVKKLKNKIESIENLKIDINTTNSLNEEYKNKFHLYINGADNEGIVYSFSNYFSKLNINIEEVSTSIKNAPVSATPLFMMDLIITTSEEINENKIIKDLNKLSEKLGVEVNLKKY
jgi:glycine cleavage system regulatory protein